MYTHKFLMVVGLSIVLASQGDAQNTPPIDPTGIPLEELGNIVVTSVARKEQKLSQTAAAVFVITQDDIRRSGATNIPDVLRMAPGVNVARIDANTWAISIRGFNGRYSDKVLILIDSRSVYMPSFSGAYWDQVDVPLEDIERIEIIRGPGGAAWGANAMNGVINIITMKSNDTRGGLIISNAGSRGTGALIQYGSNAGSIGSWRAFGNYSNTESSLSQSGSSAADGWHTFHGGFRTDLQASSRDTLMVQGDLFETGEGQTLTTVLQNQLPAVATFNDPIAVDGGDLHALWTHNLQNGATMSLNMYYNHVNRVDETIAEGVNSFDIDFQHRFALNSRNDVVWGLAYRYAGDKITGGYDTVWNPSQRNAPVYSAFVQDEIKLAESLRFTLGTKLEDNGYTGFEYEPSARVSWAPAANQTFWASASQAIRQPDRQDVDLQYDIAIIPLGGNSFGTLQFMNNQGIQTEVLRDYEVGYRTRLGKNLTFDLAGFRGYYHHLETTVPEDPYPVNSPGPPHLVFPLELGNSAAGRTYGGEVFATWQVNRRWRLSPGFDLLHMFLYESRLSQSSTAAAVPGDSPKHQIHLRSSVSLARSLDWDSTLTFVGSLSDQQVPAYTRLDTQLRWRIRRGIEFDLTGQNLLRPRHNEFSDGYEVNFTQVQRSFFSRVTWRF